MTAEASEKPRNMSDETLEILSAPPGRTSVFQAPWVCWESENAGMGKAFRQWMKYPSFVPMFMVSPHGAYSGTKIWPNEVDERAKIFFGWPRERVERRNSEHGLPSFLVPHPWLAYRARRFPTLPTGREGLLFFMPHSNDHFAPELSANDELRLELSKLQENFGEVTIALGFHDVLRGVHREMRNWGFPLVTAGNTNSPQFVDRFYSMVSSFRYTASSNLGSQVYYCIEAGLPHFITESNPKLIGTGRGAVKKGYVAEHINYGTPRDVEELEKFEQSMRVFSEAPTQAQLEFVHHALGKGQGIGPGRAASILWAEVFRNKKRLLLFVRPFFRQMMRNPIR